jgi:hypothetical protein
MGPAILTRDLACLAYPWRRRNSQDFPGFVESFLAKDRLANTRVDIVFGDDFLVLPCDRFEDEGVRRESRRTA